MIVSRWASEQAELDPNVTAEELTETANYILLRQFISRKDRSGSAHYMRAVANLGYYTNLFAGFGFRFVHSDQWGYAGYVSPVAFKNARVSKIETIVLLCLRHLYSTSAEKGYFVDGTADILIEEDEIADIFASLGARQIKNTELRSILEGFRRHGLVSFDVSQPSTISAEIIICAPIVDAVDETFIARFNDWATQSASTRETASAVADEDDDINNSDEGE